MEQEHEQANVHGITCKNDLYAFEGDELRNSRLGRSRGTLRRVRAAYEWCEFETAAGTTVRRSVDEIMTALENGYTFQSPPDAEGEQ